MTERRGLIWAAVSTKKQTADDKHSIPIQIKDAQAFFEREGITIVDTLVVPGHSRRYKDFGELAAKAAAKGIDAFIKLERYWRDRAFDVLWVRGGDRFARTQSLHARITEEVIDSGAEIYSSEDGWISKANYRMWTAMSGYAAASRVDQLITAGRKTKDERAALGLGINARVWWSHKVIRNEYGKILKIVPDETKRLVIEDAARLVIAGVGWHRLEIELYEQFGHTNSGKPFTHTHFYHLFHNPGFWGHSARRWRHNGGPNGRRVDLWVFDDSVPAPDGVLIFYNTHAPALDGELAELLQAELRRRRSAIRGSTRPQRTKKFSGLLICGYCGYHMVWVNNGAGRNYWRCGTAAHGKSQNYSRDCPGQYVREDYIEAWFRRWLELVVEKHNPHIDAEGNLPGIARPDETASLQTRLTDVRNRARRLIALQAAADDTLSSIYDEQIREAGREIKALESRLSEQVRTANTRELREIETAYRALQATDLEAFWRQEETAINSFLHRLVGRRRVILVDKEIRAIARKA